jgi:hypothetical protein
MATPQFCLGRKHFHAWFHCNSARPGDKWDFENGRGGEIRTHDLLYPKQARYQATLRPDTGLMRLPLVIQKGNAEFWRSTLSQLKGRRDLYAGP